LFSSARRSRSLAQPIHTRHAPQVEAVVTHELPGKQREGNAESDTAEKQYVQQ